MSHLLYDVSDGVATITLNRPERKNAFTVDMVDAWADALRRAQSDDAVRVVVVTGAGDSFCSGVDLATFRSASRTPLQEKQLLTDHVHRVALAHQDMDKPVIAAVNGAAVGAGMDMALLCDLRLGSRSARFCEGYVRVGLVPGDGGAWLLPRVVGTAAALRLLWTGDFVDADEALRLGLVESVHDDDHLLGEAEALARRIAGRPPVVTAMIKRAVRHGATSDLRTSLDLISSHMAIVTSTEDYQESTAAFAAGRNGEFIGR